MPHGVPTGRFGGRARAATILLVTFLAGTATGFVLSNSRARPGASTANAGRSGVRVFVKEGLPTSFDQLNLSIRQRQLIVDILARARPRTDSTMRDVIPRLRAITDSVDAEIRAVLDSTQRERLSTIRGATDPVLLFKHAETKNGPSRVDTIRPRRTSTP